MSDTVLLIGADELTRTAFAQLPEDLDDTRLLMVDRIGDALKSAHEAPPLLVIARHAPGSLNAFDVCHKVKADLRLASRVFAVATEPAHMEWDRAFGAGADAVLPWPLTIADVRLMVSAARRVRQLHDALLPRRTGSADRVTLHAIDDTWLAALTALRDELQPNAPARAEQIVAFSHDLAALSGMPAPRLLDLDHAGRYGDIGDVFCRLAPTTASGIEWHTAARALGTFALLMRIEGLAGAAELTAMATENWNGSGFPRGIARADIPLRARILRVARDYILARETGSAKPGDVISRGAGTLYDPVLVEHFKTLVAVSETVVTGADSEIVPVGVLRSGMTLAADVFAHGGLVLLNEGTVLTPHTIKQILRVHYIEPIRPGIRVRRAAAA